MTDEDTQNNRVSDAIIWLRVWLGFAFLYAASFLMRVSSCLLDMVPLTAMELHTAYYRASYDKEHGEGAADLICSFYDAYLRPDIEEEFGIQWVRT